MISTIVCCICAAFLLYEIYIIYFYMHIKQLNLIVIRVAILQ